MEVLILSKTQMNNRKCCVGGMTSTGKPVRLLTANGENQDERTSFQIGQIWNLRFISRTDIEAPHIEDVLVQSATLLHSLGRKETILGYIQERKIDVWQGIPEILFDSQIKWTGAGSGYIDKTCIPKNSVGFWISDKDLRRNDYNGIRYSYPDKDHYRSIKYKGYEDPVDMIPKGTLLRVSLARWVSWDENDSPKCWLQLSGWYDIN